MHYSSENHNVPIEKESINTLENDILANGSKTKNNKFAIFSLKIPNKKELIENIDNFIPIGIVILTLFVAFVA